MVISVTEQSSRAAGTADYDATVLLNTIYLGVQSCAKVAVIVFILWFFVRFATRDRRQSSNGTSDTSHRLSTTVSDTRAKVEARRKQAWKREQKKLDELSAAAISAKKQHTKLKEDVRVAAVAAKGAKERAYRCTRAADAARMLRRRAVDQFRLSANDKDKTWSDETLREVVDREREEAQASIDAENAVANFNKLRNLLEKGQ